MSESYIRFENVVKSYGSGNAQINALSGVSFEIEKGEFCILLASSGAGFREHIGYCAVMQSIQTNIRK